MQASLEITKINIPPQEAYVHGNVDVSRFFDTKKYKLAGASFAWATGSACVASNIQATSDTQVYITLFNMHKETVSVSTIVIILFLTAK